MGTAAEDHEDQDQDVEELVDEKQAVFGDPIVGIAEILSDENGPGARTATPLPTPKGMSHKKWLEHCLFHLPYDPACPSVLHADVLINNIVLPTSTSA